MTLLNGPAGQSEIQNKPCSGIECIIKPKEKDLGGFSVRRLLPSPRHKSVGPWVFFDHMGPAEFKADEGINVPPHPHINMATVTYLFEGEILHRDSLGNEQLIMPGEINVMIAGKGIVHSERERPETKRKPHKAHGLQLWLALPEDQEECDPAFYHYIVDQIPRLSVDGAEIRVMMGSAFGVDSPVTTMSDTLYVEAHLQKGQKLVIPKAAERAVYAAEGDLVMNTATISTHEMAVLIPNADICVEALTESRIAIIGGAPLGKRYIEWNFVSSSKKRIEEAREAWKAGKYTRIPGDDEEFIPLPE